MLIIPTAKLTADAAEPDTKVSRTRPVFWGAHSELASMATRRTLRRAAGRDTRAMVAPGGDVSAAKVAMTRSTRPGAPWFWFG